MYKEFLFYLNINLPVTTSKSVFVGLCPLSYSHHYHNRGSIKTITSLNYAA